MRLPLSVGGAFCRPFHRSLHSFDRISIVVTQYQWRINSTTIFPLYNVSPRCTSRWVGAHAIASFARIDLRRRN